MMKLEAATVLLQWAVGGMAFCWFTTRRRLAGLGYGWLLRGVYGLLAAGAAWLGFRLDDNPVRDVSAVLVALSCAVALAVSVAQREAGVSGQRAEHDRRTARVAAMTGIDRRVSDPRLATGGLPDDEPDPPAAPREFDPRWDLLPVAVGLIGLVAAALDTDANAAVALVRTLAGAAFLGAITDAMLLGHWYLVQPGLPRS